jgi:B-box zinc finger/Zinc finger, C3HC4 type (RING finger)
MTTGVARDLRKQLTTITECSVCMNTFHDPRTLPCIHTFCLKCTKGFCKDKLSGDCVACPICRTEFTVPFNGVDGLPKNFFVEQLKDIADKSSSNCEGCDENQNKQAVKFCTECRQRFCEDCVVFHRRFRATQEHELIEIDDEEGMVAAVGRMITMCCDKHPKEALKLYCLDCQTAICFMCFAEQHSSHKCSDVNKVADEFRQQMTLDVGRMIESISKCREMLNVEEQRKKDFSSMLDGIEKEICERVKQLKQIIDSEKCVLMRELETRRKDREKQLQHVIEEIEQHKSFATILVTYTEEIRDKGTASDVVQQRSALHDRADELIKLDNIHREVNGLGLMNVKFEAAKIPVTSSEKLVGQIHWEIDNGK